MGGEINEQFSLISDNIFIGLNLCKLKIIQFNHFDRIQTTILFKFRTFFRSV